MQPEVLYEILDYVNFEENREIAELAGGLRSIGQDIPQLDKAILELKGSLKENYADPFYKKSPYCHFLLACTSYLAGHPEAIIYAERAESQFKNQGKMVDQSLANWLLGFFLKEGKQIDRARVRIDDAIYSLASIIKARSNNGIYSDCDSCQEILNKIKIFRNSFTTPENSNPSPFRPNLNGQDGYLSFPQLPTYHNVQAGSDGPIWAATTLGTTCTETDHFIIGNRQYTIFSVIRGDRRITLDPNRQYGWAPVEGNSMNLAQPTPINAGDLVLFYQSNEAAGNAFVIVSCPADEGSGYKFMVKRWNKINQEFLSDSSESGHSPIPCGKECRIIGIVTGVAKPS